MISKFNNRIFGLDVIRSLAIFFVLWGHSYNIISPYIKSKYYNLYFLNIDGVSIFFVLSGYLIGTIVLREISYTNLNYKNLFVFWCKRWFRTLPLYFIVLTIVIILSDKGFSNFKEYYYFLQNFSSPHPKFFPEAWSLSVEEIFYLIIPLIFFSAAIFFKEVDKILILMITILIVCPIVLKFLRFMEIEVINSELRDLFFRRQVITRMDSIMWGILAAYLKFKKILNLKNKSYLILGCFLIVINSFFMNLLEIYNLEFNYVNGFYYYVFSFTITSVGVALTLHNMSCLNLNYNNFLKKFVGTISITSYSMYLLNFTLILGYCIPFSKWFFRSIVDYFNLRFNYEINYFFPDVINWAFFWVLCIVLSFLTYKVIEKPFLNIRNIIFKND